MLWLTFFLWAAVVVVAGTFVGRIVAALGDRLRLGQAWAGTVLLSIATTLPEIVTTSSLASRGAIGIALGNIVGSCIFNLFILILMDLLSERPVYDRLSANHIATGLLGCALLAIAIVGIALGDVGLFGATGLSIGPLGITAFAILCLYGLGQYLVYRIAQGSFLPVAGAEPGYLAARPMWLLVSAFVAIAGVIMVAAYQLGVSVETISARYALGETFAGATLLGIVTSLPEVTNGVTATRRGQLDLVLGNVLGANAFLLLVLALADAFFLRGALFYSIGRTEAMSSIIMAATAIVMQTIVLGAVAVRSTHRVWRFGFVSIVLIVLYAFSLAVAYAFPSS